MFDEDTGVLETGTKLLILTCVIVGEPKLIGVDAETI